jgi:hypothetical protein
MGLIAGMVSIACFLWWIRSMEEKLIEVYGGKSVGSLPAQLFWGCAFTWISYRKV